MRDRPHAGRSTDHPIRRGARVLSPPSASRPLQLPRSAQAGRRAFPPVFLRLGIRPITAGQPVHSPHGAMVRWAVECRLNRRDEEVRRGHAQGSGAGGRGGATRQRVGVGGGACARSSASCGSIACCRALTPEKATSLLEDLGPTFVKMGQIAANRSDVIPPAYADAFKRLRADVPPMPFSTVLATIEESLGHPWRETFSCIEEKPLGSASIAQVHRARIAPHAVGDAGKRAPGAAVVPLPADAPKAGSYVAIKVRRPHVVEQMTQDLALIRQAVALEAAHPCNRRHQAVAGRPGHRAGAHATRQELGLLRRAAQSRAVPPVSRRSAGSGKPAPVPILEFRRRAGHGLRRGPHDQRRSRPARYGPLSGEAGPAPGRELRDADRGQRVLRCRPASGQHPRARRRHRVDRFGDGGPAVGARARADRAHVPRCGRERSVCADGSAAGRRALGGAGQPRAAAAASWATCWSRTPR